MSGTPVPARAESLSTVVGTLEALSDIDLPFADQYLHRAELLLARLLARHEYLALRRDGEDLPRLQAALRQAIERAEWSHAHALAEEAAAKKDRVSSNEEILKLADAVYGPRILHAGPTALALNGIVAHPGSALERERLAIVGNLQLLAARDEGWKAFYRTRAEHFDRITVVEGHEGPVVDRDELRRRVLGAVQSSDFSEVRRLTEVLAENRPGAALRGRLTMPKGRRVEALAQALPASAVPRGRELGLAAETLPPSVGINAYLSCGCGDCPTFPERPLSETDRRPGACRTCGHASPAGLSPALRENLDLLLLHPFMTSAGTRYLPWFGEETLLVETFPETDPDARTPLLQELGLARRRALPRIAIEDALRTHTARLCEELGLDPFEFTPACIPFDAYCRLSARYGWGRDHLWTHFDGYQVTRELNLMALVGGDAQYGGPDDFCAVQRDYDSAKITVRFCVLRRERFFPTDGTITGDSEAMG